MPEKVLQQLQEMIVAGNIPEMIQLCMRYALEKGASDIHIEPSKNFTRMRIRIDGVLRVIVEYPLNLHPGIVSKIKIMSNLKIDETRVPQDGRITTYVGETEADLRVSTLPTPNGEKIVMRLVDKSKKIPALKDLGIIGHNAKLFEAAIAEPNGIILTSGPTGSGKTTTMYSAMGVLNRPEVNIMTFEDPIENQMEGLNQSQVRSDIGYTFANGLRTALRQDPDIIMVGEIRDRETIDIAIEASLTGHLVLSTIHTNSAIETITRILNMKVPDFLVTASVNLIMAQRLARRLCPKCKIPTPPSADAQRKMREAFDVFEPYEGFDMNLLNDPMFFSPNPKGCDECEGKGYKGRIGIYELLDMGEEIKKGLLQGLPSFELQKIAQKEGMITLEQDGLIKAAQGLSSLEEVYKLVKN
ncbi:type II/IV secretion system protein [bacterium]|jgi:type IV pilus assembly protein PilB|nr:type II/IV secretion system protein [bacterium]MBT6831783.1 type II/IV secretion system protein [bacterium]MBT6995990.1 type II/IV secretion system protein [bacterium]MBT7772639.1 type II/IV secretion system protein [bacterium]